MFPGKHMVKFCGKAGSTVVMIRDERWGRYEWLESLKRDIAFRFNS